MPTSAARRGDRWHNREVWWVCKFACMYAGALDTEEILVLVLLRCHSIAQTFILYIKVNDRSLHAHATHHFTQHPSLACIVQLILLRSSHIWTLPTCRCIRILHTIRYEPLKSAYCVYRIQYCRCDLFITHTLPTIYIIVFLKSWSP